MLLQAAVLGFVGSPWTLATYLIEGGSTPLYKKIKAMTAAAPEVLSALLQHLAVQIAEYMCFQVGGPRFTQTVPHDSSLSSSEFEQH